MTFKSILLRLLNIKGAKVVLGQSTPLRGLD